MRLLSRAFDKSQNPDMAEWREQMRANLERAGVSPDFLKDKERNSLTDGIFVAAARVGGDGLGMNGVIGYIERNGMLEPEFYANWMKVLLRRNTAEPKLPSMEEIKAELLNRGMTLEQL